MTMTRRTSRNGKGATIVEFAMVFPLLLLLMFGVMDFGFYFFVQHSLQFATREGVRLALVGGSGTPEARAATMVQTIRSKASMAVRPADVLVYIYPVNSNFADPAALDTTQNSAGLAGSYMRVKTRYTYRFITPLVGALVPGRSKVIEVQATYRNELFN